MIGDWGGPHASDGPDQDEYGFSIGKGMNDLAEKVDLHSILLLGETCNENLKCETCAGGVPSIDGTCDTSACSHIRYCKGGYQVQRLIFQVKNVLQIINVLGVRHFH